MLRAARILATTLVLSLLVVIAAAVALAGWVLHTDAGTAWAFERARGFVPGRLSVAAMEGAFASGLRIAGLEYAGPGAEVRAARLVVAIEPELFPPALTIEVLEAGEVRVALVPSPAPAGPDRPFSPESLALPFELFVRDLVLEDFELVNAGGDVLLAIDRAALAGRWHESISLSRLALESPLATVEGSAVLSLARPFAADATLDIRRRFEIGGDSVPLAIKAEASGSLERLDVALRSGEPELAVEGQLTGLLDEPGWTLEARGPRLTWPLAGAEPAVTLADVALASRGGPSGYSLQGRGSVATPVLEAHEFALDGRGDTDGIEVSQLELEGPAVTARSQGSLRWAGGLAARIEADVERLDPAAVTGEWPAGAPLSGRAVAGFNPGKLELESLEATVRGTGRSLSAAGLVDLEARVVDLDVGWQDWQWPLAGAAWRLKTERGRVTVSGSPDDWKLDGTVALAAPELPPGTFVLSGEGSREAFTVVVHDSEVLGGRIAGRVHYTLPEGGRWVATLSARGVDTGALLPDWPGRLDAELATRGRLAPLELAVDVDRLEGSLRGRPITGSGGFRWARGNLAVQQLVLASGEAVLRANGSLRAEEGLDFELDVPSLAAVLPQAAGALDAGGTVFLAGGMPRATAGIEARGLAWRDWRVERLRVSAREAAEPLVVELDAEALRLAGVELDRLSAELAAGETRQRLGASLASGAQTLELALEGAFEDWRRPLESAWRGRLETLAAGITPDLRLALEAPASLAFGPGHAALEPVCLVAADGPTRICARGVRSGSGEYDFSADLTAVPVGLVKLALDTELEFTQAVDGSLNVRRRAGRALSADARIDIAPGRVYHPADPRMNLDTRAGLVHLDLDDGRVLLARLSLPVGATTAIDAEFGVQDVRQGEDSRISGKVVANVSDIGVLTALVPTLPRAQGSLGIDLAVDGTLDSPSVTGNVSLANGALTYAPLGLDLDDIELETRIGEGNRIDLTSTFRAGQGHGRLESSTDGLDGAGLRLRLTGDDLEMVKLPQLTVVTDMDIGVGVSPGELTLNGWVAVPRARIAPSEIASGKVSESEDVVIVASDDQAVETQPAATAPLELFGRVGLTLGDDVIVDFDAAQTRLSGSVAFDWNGPPMPTAIGEYKVTGRFEAYGQLLEITEGSIRFPSVPANNPQLRIRAEREIFGNPQIRTAGVLVSGSAREPEIEVYTNPETTRERALTLLVTGSDFDYEQGVGAVDVGTYIAPDLFLSYGIGLFDRENVISLRYDIARGFGIKATSGRRTEGIDLSYTFER
ncbi:MAG TPA: translocation/assembly module TamB domain-containing protein [Woeseiaceae bacterium]|nr:translocation/assembly module TamB domain-containing protein [Woeseiaceae bacterium]